MRIDRRLLFGELIAVAPPVGPDDRRWMIVCYDPAKDHYLAQYMAPGMPVGRVGWGFTSWSRKSLEDGSWVVAR